MAKIVEVRNSTAEFLTFVAANKLSASRSQGTQFVIPAYQRNYTWVANREEGVQVAATTEKISVVQLEGSHNVNREPTFYNLDAIISVGYTNTPRNMPRLSSNATASSRTACSAATSRKCSWRVVNCLSCR